MQKAMVILGCCLLIAGALPAAVAHNTSGAARQATSSSGVSGVYFNTPSPPVPLVGGVGGTYVFLGDPDGDESPGITVNDDVTLFGAGFVAAAGALCDMEVLSGSFDEENGDSEAFLNEQVVDNTPVPDGSLDDGLIDDGGIGAACHVTTYQFTPYETGGCSGKSYAFDVVLQHAVWIGAACDYQATGTTSFANCMANVAINGLGNPVGRTNECVQNLNVGNPGSIGTVLSCNPLGATDAINYGSGGPGVDYPQDACSDADHSFATPSANDNRPEAATFVFNYVGIDGTTIESVQGWVDNQ